MMPLLALALAGLSLATAPTVEPRAPAGTAAVTDRQAAKPIDGRNYCFKYEITGSIMRYKTCKTYAEWMKQGVDPTAKHD